MAFRGPLEDRLAIRELVETYNDAVFRRDAAAWADTWTDDAEWDMAGLLQVSGRENILEAWKGAMAGFSYVAFIGIPGAIEVDGDRATARVYVSEVLIPAGGELRRVEGAYDDTLRKDGGTWRFVKRVYKILRDDAAPN